MLRNQKGQSTTSVLILAMTLLVPLLVGMQYVGKLADLKHKTLEAARYAAWERTVFGDRAARRKTPNQIENEIINRVFSDPTALINTRTDGNQVITQNSRLDWMHHTQYERYGQNSRLLRDMPGYQNRLLEYRHTTVGQSGNVNAVISTVADRGMNLPDGNVDVSRITVNATKLPMFNVGNNDLLISSRVALLGEDWSAAPGQVKERIEDLNPMTILNNGIINIARSAFGTIFTEVQEGHLDIGRVDEAQVPASRLR